jgi:hypothetical protein
MRYFFDVRDDEAFSRVESGVECPSLQTVKSEVIAGLVEVAVELLPETEGRKLAIEVRDEAGHHVFTTVLILKVEISPAGLN